MERKTKKFYRNEINKSYHSAKKVFIEALEKYAPKSEKNYNSWVGVDVSNDWNGMIEGFSVTRSDYDSDKHKYIRKHKHTYWVDAYVQGDDTDYSDSIRLETALANDGFQLKFTETFGNGYSHTPIAKFDKDMLYEAMKKFAEQCLN